jgi:SAM-dependent methyltransferase
VSDVPGSGVSQRWAEWRRTVDLVKYDQRWDTMAARGENVHGEADAVTRLIERYLDVRDRERGHALRILDAGCGTGRLAVELQRRGHEVTAVDLDPDMVDKARDKSTAVTWLVGDLSTVDVVTRGDLFDVAGFDVIVMAGNILNFCAPGTQTTIVHNMVNQLVDGGVFVCGWSQEQRDDAYLWSGFVRDARDAGANVAETWTNWDGDAMPASDAVGLLGGEPVRSSDYAVITVIKSS